MPAAARKEGGVGMKRGMLAVLFLVLLTSLAWGADWYRYEGTLSWNLRQVTGETDRDSMPYRVSLCYDTTPWSISVNDLTGWEWFSGEFDLEGTKLQFRGATPSGAGTFVGRASFNAKATSLNLQGWEFYRSGGRSQFGQIQFRGKFLDIALNP
jgi:hypothetical protein